MKTLKSLLYVLGATLLFAGCSDDDTVTVGAEDDPNCYGVYFPSQENIGDLEFDPAAAPEAKFIVRRNRDNDAITVPVTITGSEEGIFTATEIEFDEGQTETEFIVSFDGTEVGQTYSCEINIEDPLYASLYSERATGFKFSVTRVKWDLVKGPNGETKGKWRDDLFSSLFGIDNVYAEKEIEIYERADQPGYYRIKDIYDTAYTIALFGGNYGGFTSTYTILDATNPDMIYLPKQWTGRYVGSDGVLGFASNVPQNGFRNGSDYGKNENGVFTFPANGVLVNFDSDPEGWYYGNGSGMLRIMLPGAKSYDYSLALSAGETVDGKVNIAVRFGADVAKVKYAFYTGSTNDATVEVRGGEIAAGDTPSQELSAAGTVEAQFDATGAYSMVAVAYNAAGEATNTAYADFGYVAAGDEEEQAVVMTVLTELTNEYAAQGITKENSIKVIMYGQNIQSGYYGLFSTASVEGLTEAQLLQALPASGDPFTEEDLADINGSGWVDTFTKLSKGTSYTMLVMVNNGYYTKLYAVEQTTQGDPDPFDIHYTFDDLLATPTKEKLFGTEWNYYAVDAYDDNDNINRQYLGTVTFSENTEDDTASADFVNATGFTSSLAQALSTKDDTFAFQRLSNGLLVPTPNNYFGQVSLGGNTYYVRNGFSCEEKEGVYPTQNGTMYGGYVAEGFMAFTPNPNFTDQGYTFVGLWFGAYTGYDGTNWSGGVGGLAHYQYLLLVDPEYDPNEAASTAVSKALKIQPTNYVELRGEELAKALHIEQLGGLKARKANIKGASVSRPVEAQTTFKAGQFPQYSGDTATKIAAKNLVVKTK